MVEIQGPDDDSPPGRSLTPPPSPEDHARLDLDGKVTSLAYAFDAMRRQMDATTERTARIEGVISALMSSLDNLRGDNRDLAARTEQRVLRGLEFLDARLAHSQGSGQGSEHLNQAVETLQSRLAALEDRMARGLELIRDQGDKLAETAETLHRLENRLSQDSHGTETVLESVIQSTERSTKTLDQLIAGLERMDARVSHQVSSSEYALHGTLAELERRLTEQVSEAVRSIEARVRQREETLVRLMVGGGIERPEDR